MLQQQGHHQLQQTNHLHQTTTTSKGSTTSLLNYSHHQTLSHSNSSYTHISNPYPTQQASHNNSQLPSPRGNSLQKLLTSSTTAQSQDIVRNAALGGVADKRVLSILRNSLEIKEARMTQLQNQLQQSAHLQRQRTASLQQNQQMNQYLTSPTEQMCYVQNMTAQQPEAPVQLISHQKPSPSPTLPPTSRHNLPTMTAGLENDQSVVAMTKLHTQKTINPVGGDEDCRPAMTRIHNEPQKIRRIDTENVHSNMMSNSAPGGNGDLDGLAAYLAARIRTKAELKQVGPLDEMNSSGQQQFRSPTPVSSAVSVSNSSVHSSRTTPGTPVVFSPQPVQDSGVECDQSSARMSSEQVPSNVQPSNQGNSGGTQSSGSPPKLTRERVACPPRRRLFSRPDEELGGSGAVSVAAAPVVLPVTLAPPRDMSGLRSSSETSVFDFRDSDSEGEMPVLERQTLDEMRRDRKSHTKQIQPLTADKSKEVLIEVKIEKVDVEEGETDTDPIWGNMCDKFMEELKQGTHKIKKRGRRKKASPTALIPARSKKMESKAIKEEVIEGNEKTNVTIENVDANKHMPTVSKRNDTPETKDELLRNVDELLEKKNNILRKADCGNETKKSLDVKTEVDIENGTTIKEKTSENKETFENDKEKLDKVVVKKEVIEEKKSKRGKSPSKEKLLEKSRDKPKEKSVEKDRSSERKNKSVGKDKSLDRKEQMATKKTEASKKVKKEPKIATKDIRKWESDNVPIVRRSRGRPRKNIVTEKEVDKDVDDEISLAEMKARLGKSESSKEVSVAGSDSSTSSESELSGSEEEVDTVARRLRKRKCQSKEEKCDRSAVGMRLRSKDSSSSSSVTPKKESPPDKGKATPVKLEISAKTNPVISKPSFGDGSDFRPGWEEELYRFKRSLRMPLSLINIPRPSNRMSTSLPDLDPYPNSPSTSTIDSSDFNPDLRNTVATNLFNSRQTWSSLRSDLADSDIESISNISMNWNPVLRGDEIAVDSEEATSSTTLSAKNKTKLNSSCNSLLNDLLNRFSQNIYPPKKSTESKDEKNSVNLLSRTKSKTPEPKSTSSLGIELSKDSSNSMGKVGYFRKKGMNDFRDAFLKNRGILGEGFSPAVFKSRTRTETLVMRQRATVREVFGADRPASAPPACRDDSSEEADKEGFGGDNSARTNGESANKTPGGLRSAALLRSNKAVLNSKRRLLHGKIRRNHDLLRVLATKKLSSLDIGTPHPLESDPTLLLPQLEGPDQDIAVLPNSPAVGKRIKLRSVRRKFRSGFDYIRKKKKYQKKDVDLEGTKEKRKVVIMPKQMLEMKHVGKKTAGEANKEMGGTDNRKRALNAKKLSEESISEFSLPRPSSESVQDIQNEIRGWVINKGLGETLLHRAARLGYTVSLRSTPPCVDVAAYCLENLDMPSSPRDNAGYTPLHEACLRGHLEIARLLLMYGANVSDCAPGGFRPLHEAVDNGNLELIRLLLSYGADPLLETYNGSTPLSLANNEDVRRLMQHHLADVQGRSAPPWHFEGPASFFDPVHSGYDPLKGPPLNPPEPPELEEMEFETSEVAMPVLYSLVNEAPNDRWVLLQDVMAVLRFKTRDAVLRQLNTDPAVSPKSTLRELKMADFLEQAHCCHVLGAGERINVRASKVALLKYTDKMRELLGIEKVTLNLR
uniref:BCL-6 corepressor n=1 Tax=Timema genevievae TaxID=629358 RepID=A0A7R9PLI8_TIMGE|nr:unnamed protein product [Timema genevievae]